LDAEFFAEIFFVFVFRGKNQFHWRIAQYAKLRHVATEFVDVFGSLIFQNKNRRCKVAVVFCTTVALIVGDLKVINALARTPLSPASNAPNKIGLVML